MKEIIFFNTNLSPYILRYHYEGSVSGRQLRDYLHSVYGLRDKKIIMMRLGQVLLDHEHLTTRSEISWIWLP